MKALFLSLLMLGAFMAPVVAQETCITKDIIKEKVAQDTPDAVIPYESEDYLMFSSPSKPTDLLMHFEKGCLDGAVNLEKKPLT